MIVVHKVKAMHAPILLCQELARRDSQELSDQLRTMAKLLGSKRGLSELASHPSSGQAPKLAFMKVVEAEIVLRAAVDDYLTYINAAVNRG